MENITPSRIQVGGKHYKTMEIQPAEFCQKNKLPFCESSVVKYLSRHSEKGGAEDINKAIHFLQLLLEWDYPNNPFDSGLLSDLDLYQIAAQETAIYPTLGHPIVYPALGLAGEAGEVAEKVKKLCRDSDGIISEDFRLALKKELGDVLWYISEVARQIDLTMSDVAWSNIKKLHQRQQKGKLHGSGDNREDI